MKYTAKIHKNLIVSVIIALTLLSGCITRSAELQAMLKSSVATTQLMTAREINRVEQDKATSLGKPILPELILEYEPINNHTKEEVFSEIIASLDKSGWKTEKLSIPQPDYFKATLPQDNFSLLAEVSIQSQRNIVRITLTTIPR